MKNKIIEQRIKRLQKKVLKHLGESYDLSLDKNKSDKDERKFYFGRYHGLVWIPTELDKLLK